ncbi:MAG: hypothetical protein WC926_00985 [Candidatus Paceibacterota bacterium]|jgi:hypothetical protein
MTNSERPLILLTALFTIGVLFIVFYLILPACNNADGVFFKMKELEKKTAELDTLQSYHKKVLAVRDELENLNNDKADGLNWEKLREKISINLTRDDPMFLPKAYLFFQQQCQGISTLNSVVGSKAASVMKEGGEEAAGLKGNDFSLSILSSYDNFKELLAKLETQALVIDIKEIRFSSIMPAEQTKKGALVPGNMPFNLVLSVPSY